MIKKKKDYDLLNRKSDILSGSSNNESVFSPLAVLTLSIRVQMERRETKMVADIVPTG